MAPGDESWRWLEGGDDARESRLGFDLRPVPEGTERTLAQSRLLTDAACRSHEQGWSGALDKPERQFRTTKGDRS